MTANDFSIVWIWDVPNASGQAPDMMDILMDISSQLKATEHFVQEAENDKAAAAATRRRASRSQRRTGTWGQRVPTASAGSQNVGYEFDAVHTTTADLLDAVREKVKRHLQQVPLVEITTTDADLDSEKENRECSNKMWPLKSGELRIADSMVMQKVTSLHELVYTMVE